MRVIGLGKVLALANAAPHAAEALTALVARLEAEPAGANTDVARILGGRQEGADVVVELRQSGVSVRLRCDTPAGLVIILSAEALSTGTGDNP